jgi:hypothetical protein
MNNEIKEFGNFVITLIYYALPNVTAGGIFFPEVIATW